MATDWSAATLCTHADILAIEPSWLDWTPTPEVHVAAAKMQIERRLRYAFRKIELLTDATDVLDLISNLAGSTDEPPPLREAAVYKTLELTAQAASRGADGWQEKGKYYRQEFNREFPLAVEMLHIDLDESGAIDDSEKYNTRLDVRFSR